VKTPLIDPDYIDPKLRKQAKRPRKIILVQQYEAPPKTFKIVQAKAFQIPIVGC
jgi:hypothetical protein